MKRVCIALIRFYQRHLSRLKPYSSCRFTPTCSCYAVEAFEKRGFFAGFVLTVWRILRCSPLSPGGYDPVPEKGFHTIPFTHRAYRKQCERAAKQTEKADPADGQAPSDSDPTP